MLRKIIYIGECGDGVVYFDTVRHIALIAQRSMLLSQSGAAYTNKFIPLLIFLLIFGVGGFVANPFGGHYTYATLVFLVVLWMLEFFGMIFLLNRALYKNVKLAKPTDATNFRVALYGNLIWQNFSNKKVTLQKKLVFLVLIMILLIVNVSIVPIMMYAVIPDIENRAPIDSGIVISSLWGLMPAVLFLMIWQNNPLQFLKVAEKYQKRQLIWQHK